MAANFGPRRAAGRGRRRAGTRTRVLVGLSPVWLLAGFMLAEKFSASGGGDLAGSAAVAQDLEPLTPADGERLAGIEPSGAAETDAPKGTEVASLDAPTSDEPGLPPELLADQRPAPASDAAGERSALRAVSTPEDRARAVEGWQMAPDDLARAEDADRLAASGSIVVPQPRWKNRATAATPVPRPRPEWLPDEDRAGLATQREAVAVPEPADERRAALRDGDARIVIHHGTPSAESAARRLGEAVEGEGLGGAELRRVDVDVSQANVRYFHPQDRAAAEAVNRVLRRAGYGSDVQDFTEFDPPPSLGTVEVWLPG